MNTIIATVQITLDDQGVVQLSVSGATLQQKALVYGLLEIAKDIIRGAPTSVIQPATLGDLPH